MIREITSTSNPLVKRLRALARSKKARQREGVFLVEGWRALSSLLGQGTIHCSLEMLVVSNDWKDDARLPSGVERIVVPDFVFERISDVRNAQGILAVVRHEPSAFEVFQEGNYLLLDAIRDPGNLGTLVRSAVGAGFDAVLLHGGCAELSNPKAIRSTMGTFAFARVWEIGDGELEQLLSADYELCVTTGTGGENLYAARFGRKNILAVGSEAHGISDALARRATRRLTIPLRPECESLNAAVAGSICMFQMVATAPR